MSLLDLAPPHSVEAEQGVIGGLMLDNSTWDLIADVLSADDFFRRDHRLIYQAIEQLASLILQFRGKSHKSRRNRFNQRLAK